MRSIQSGLSFATFVLMIVIGVPVCAQDSPGRKELRRVDLSGAPGMEVISSISEYRPGEGIPLHFHHGIEAGYVLEGAMVQSPGKPAFMLPTGASVMNLRDVQHAGFTVVGEKTLKLFTVHIVDKGKPLYDGVQK